MRFHAGGGPVHNSQDENGWIKVSFKYTNTTQQNGHPIICNNPLQSGVTDIGQGQRFMVHLYVDTKMVDATVTQSRRWLQSWRDCQVGT